MNWLKKKLITSVASTILGNNRYETLLCNLTSISFFRENFKLKVIPIAYSYILFDRPEIRLAKIGDYQFYVNIAETSGICLYFFKYHYEPYAAYLVSELIRSNDVCIDIGANIGSYTFTMANLVGRGGKVIAFEPQTNLYQLLQDSIKLNKAEELISLESSAVWKRSNELLRFYLSQDPHNSGLASLIDHGDCISPEVYTEVHTITLTDCFQEQNIQNCRLVKIDVERAEFEVLQGMEPLLRERRIDYILLEQLADSESQHFLDKLGYKGQFIDEVTKSLTELNLVPPGTFGNYLFRSPNVQ